MNRTVLLAEDEQNIVESLTFVLGRAGFAVEHAPDGQDALTKARLNRPAVLILDLMLPKLSGFEVLKALRQDRSFADLPVLMLTAKGQAQDRESARALGVDAFMTKPFSNAEVVAEVERLAARPIEAGPKA